MVDNLHAIFFILISNTHLFKPKNKDKVFLEIRIFLMLESPSPYVTKSLVTFPFLVGYKFQEDHAS